MSRRKARRLARRRSGKPPDEGNPNPTPTPPQPTPPAPNPAPNPPTPTPPAPADPPQPTQAQLDAAIAQALGMSVADAKKALKAQDDARKAQMTEAERLAAEAAEEKAKATSATQQAAQAAHDARVTIALVRAGVHPDKLEWAARLVGAPVGADDKALGEAITAAKTAVPEVFAGVAPTGQVPPVPGQQPPPPSNPPGSPPAPKPTPDVKQKAAALIAERFPNLGGDKK